MDKSHADFQKDNYPTVAEDKDKLTIGIQEEY